MVVEYKDLLIQTCTKARINLIGAKTKKKSEKVVRGAHHRNEGENS